MDFQVEDIIEAISAEFGPPRDQTDKTCRWTILDQIDLVLQIDVGVRQVNLWVTSFPEFLCLTFSKLYPANGRRKGRHSNTFVRTLAPGNDAVRLTLKDSNQFRAALMIVRGLAATLDRKSTAQLQSNKRAG